MTQRKRVNIGCGQTPVPGWYNYDNSLSVRLAKYPLLTLFLDKLGLLKESQREFISAGRKTNITQADATKRLPFKDKSVEVIYSSHMLEHLDPEEVRMFLKEARRVLMPNGILRIVVPDLKKLVTRYMEIRDADDFISKSHLTRLKPKTLSQRLKYLIVGDRHHLWMYDGLSMVRLLSEMGFKEPKVLPAGQTTISDPGELNLYEREDDSVYIEAYNP
jgi:predicted SAM-dependent methyltransferase